MGGKKSYEKFAKLIICSSDETSGSLWINLQSSDDPILLMLPI